MKKILTLIMLVVLGSCTNEFDFAAHYENPLKNQYKEAFVKEFSTYGILNIDENHNWGFEDFPTVTETRSVNPNSNEWYEVPSEITEEERAYVLGWFESHRNPLSQSINWSDFFVQQVYGQNSQMDRMVVSVDGKNELDHVYNFNGSGGTIQLMQNSTTNAFGYHYSKDSKTHYRYVIAYIRGAFYVGFDAEATGDNPNQKEEPDGFYTDWIVKISPCLPKPELSKRIMAEDLGAIGDFDFNDVVFDVYINYNKWWHDGDFGIIVLRAAGGTMPLYVMDKEVHEQFGVKTQDIVNTQNGSISRPIVVWRFKPTSPNPRDVKILVNNTRTGQTYSIDADQGEAPGKICVPGFVEWTKERQNIRDMYPRFVEWIEDKTVLFWEVCI